MTEKSLRYTSPGSLAVRSSAGFAVGGGAGASGELGSLVQAGYLIACAAGALYVGRGLLAESASAPEEKDACPTCGCEQPFFFPGR